MRLFRCDDDEDEMMLASFWFGWGNEWVGWGSVGMEGWMVSMRLVQSGWSFLTRTEPVSGRLILNFLCGHSVKKFIQVTPYTSHAGVKRNDFRNCLRK